MENKERVRGPEYTATELGDLADVYEKLGQNEQALLLRQRVSEIEEKQDSQKPEETPLDEMPIDNIIDMATAFGDFGNWAEALPLLQQALKVREYSQGPEHADTLNAINQLAGACEELKQWDQALPLRQRALEICKKISGAGTEATAQAMSKLGIVYFNLGDGEKAFELLEASIAN